MDIYRSGLLPLLFSGLKADPEWLHHQILQVFAMLEQSSSLDTPLIFRSPARGVLSQLERSFCLTNTQLEQHFWGLKFPNPVGLAAGFDKDGVAASVWPSLGFGFAELGTVTFHAQAGNPRPRLFRLPQDKAALNRMGFNNQGAAALAERLSKKMGKAKRATAEEGEIDALAESLTTDSVFPINHSQFPIPLGINLGKSRVTPLEEATLDYLESFRLLKNLGDYFVINVSSPNTPGLRSLQSSEQLTPILDGLQQENHAGKPLLVKISPDLEWEAIAEILSLAKIYNLSGIIATNTTISRERLKTRIISPTGKSVQEEAGGISGAPLRDRSTEVIRFIWQQTKGQLPIIGVGGIFTPLDAWEKITAGASLIQVYTGWVYEGPGMVKSILEGLLQKLQEHKLSSISEAVGINAMNSEAGEPNQI